MIAMTVKAEQLQTLRVTKLRQRVKAEAQGSECLSLGMDEIYSSLKCYLKVKQAYTCDATNHQTKGILHNNIIILAYKQQCRMCWIT